MKRFAVAALGLLSFAAAHCRAADVAPRPAEIDDAIKKGVAWLYEQQVDGNWEQDKAPTTGKNIDDSIDGGQFGGQTALCVYALVMAGEKPSDPRIKQAVEFLRPLEMKGVYALAMRCQVWFNLPPTKENIASLRKDAQALMQSAQNNTKKNDGHQFATWDYVLKGEGYSLSRTQYAILALWAASQSGVEIPTTFWQQAEKTWITAQTAEGGWTYKHPDDTEYAATVGMTAAGLATLLIAEDYTVAPRFINANGNPPVNPAVAKSLAWIVKHWPAEVATDDTKDLKRVYPFSALYAVERVGLASGLRKFDTIDWYGGGATWLLTKQRRDGSFSSSEARGAKKGVVDSCFAILFLARGRVPVAFNKLDYSTAVADAKGAAWNQRPRDVANLTRWTGKNLERDLRWQIVTLADSDEALAESPILFLSGTKEIKFTAEAKIKLKHFIDHGGVLLACGDGVGKPFTGSIQRLAAELYPEYDFRELPATHPIYVNEVFKRDKWKTKPQIAGMTNGVRELILVVPLADWGKSFQTQRVEGKEEGWQFGLNLVAYMNDKSNFRPRGAGIEIAPDPAAKVTKSVKIARLQYNGNWNPEPAAWPQLAADLLNRRAAKLDVTPVKLGAALDGYAVAHLTGTGAVTLDAGTIASLKKFIDGGGTLIVDAAGGSEEFGASLEAQLPALATGGFKKMPAAHPLLAATPGPLKDVAYRPFAAGVAGTDTRLQMLELAGRPAVIFSKLDLTGGLVGFTIDGIMGYAPETARAIVEKIVLSAK